ncbi:MAG TPA: hypothetical protein GX734_06815 [Clostridiaceae bacterium]|jgi:uncharacterized membrane protein YkoI|nr:hypothetical protein [Clostridiaceae bacterium]
MKKHKMKMITLMFSVLFLVTAVLGCAKGQSAAELKEGTGIVLLRVNPEIAVHYDSEGLVTDIKAENDDAKVVIENIRDFKGEDVRATVKELVKAIHDAGFFVSDDGNERDITIEFVKGSVFPEDAFDKLLAKEVRTTLEAMNLDSKVLGIDFTDYDDSDYQGPTGEFITVERAKEIALNHAKVSASSATFDKVKLEKDDDVVYYDIEFKANGVEYEYEIDAVSGKVLKYERGDQDESDYDDDTDYADSNDHDDSDYKKPARPTQDDSDFDDSDHDDSDYKKPTTRRTTKPTKDDSDFDDSDHDDSDYKKPTTRRTTKPTKDDSDFDDSDYKKPTTRRTTKPTNDDSDFDDSDYDD